MKDYLCSCVHHSASCEVGTGHCAQLDGLCSAGGSGGGNLAPQDWPHGCLGYAFNLVRPALPGHRAGLLYSLLGCVLVFETLQDASAYRELVTQVCTLVTCLGIAVLLAATSPGACEACTSCLPPTRVHILRTNH